MEDYQWLLSDIDSQIVSTHREKKKKKRKILFQRQDLNPIIPTMKVGKASPSIINKHIRHLVIPAKKRQLKIS